MENLLKIAGIANQKLGSVIFEEKEGFNSIQNTKNYYEGNDLDMEEEDGVFILTLTGITETYDNIEDAAQGLIDLYSTEKEEEINE